MMTAMAVTNAPMIGAAANPYRTPWGAGLLYPGRFVPATRKSPPSTQSRMFPFLSMGSLAFAVKPTENGGRCVDTGSGAIFLAGQFWAGEM